MSAVYWTETARQQRLSALEHTAKSSLRLALVQITEIERQTQRLLRFPNIGRHGKLKGTRDLSINRTPFVVTYRVIGDNIQIMRFRHTAQKL